MSTFHVRVADGGDGGVTSRSLDDAVAAAQAIMARVAAPVRRLSDEIISERRAEARRE